VPALKIHDVSKSFEERKLRLRLPFGRPPKAAKKVMAVDSVSLAVQRGEIFGVLGANGSGKSTLIRLVSTLLIPDTGSVSVFGLDVVRDEAQVKTLINRVSVDAAFFKKLSAMENLAFAARLYGLEFGPARRRAYEILARVGISKQAASQPMEHMSRGMQQKVAIARAFLTSPALLLLDEPTTGLDPRSKKDVQAFVLELRERHDTTVVLTTHDMDEADRLCDRIAVIDKGKIIALDTPAVLKAQYGHTMEDVFMHLTGLTLEEAEAEREEED
jgi:ABC-2 type transport system ATP-binding protein